MIIRIFRIDLFVSLLISTQQIKERVTSALVINYSRRKSQGRMKGGIGYLACIVIRLLTLLLNQNDVRSSFFIIIFFCRLNLPSNELLRNFYDIFDITRCTKSRAEKILLSSEKKILFIYIFLFVFSGTFIFYYFSCVLSIFTKLRRFDGLIY